MTLVDHYAAFLVERGSVLRSMANYLAVDAYFSKLEFIKAVAENGLDLYWKTA